MPVSVDVFGGASSVLFRGLPSSMWGTAVAKPVVAISRTSGQGDRRRAVVSSLSVWET